MNKHGNVVFYTIFLILCLGFTECKLPKDIGHVNKEVVGLCKTPDGYPRHCDEKANETTRNMTEKEEVSRKTPTTTQKPVETTRSVVENATTETRKTTQKLVETTKKATTPMVEKHDVTTATPTTEDPTDKLTDLTRKDPSGKIGTTGSAALAAGICVAIALAGYTSLMVYRKMILKRYGNSEILLNEDDVADIQDEDMKHFELKLMDKDGNVVEP